MSKVTRRTALGLSLTSLVAGLSACATIPTKGEVNHYADPQTTGTPVVADQSISGPQPGASPAEIIDGFIHAGVGARDDYKVAREYLTPEKAESWRPDGRTLVYNSAYSVTDRDGGNFTLTIPTNTVIDNRGLATSYTTVVDTDIDVKLTQVDGEWRIAEVQDGTVLSRTEFTDIFNPYTLYFYDPTFTYAVPDVRWFAERTTVATSLIRVLLEGPASYLQGAVVTAIPADTRLSRNSVPINNGIAEIQLTGGVALTTASALALERLRTQLKQVLTSLPSVSEVELSINDQAVDAQALENYREPAVNPPMPTYVVAIENNRLVTRNNFDDVGSQQTVVEVSPQARIVQPAMNYTQTFFAYSNDSRSEIWLATSGGSRSIFRGEGILTSSFDHQNWLWVAERAGTVRAYPVGQDTGELRGIDTWLREETLHSLSVSRDGSRALMVTSIGEANYAAWVSAIRRDDEGAPTELLEPIRIGSDINPQGAEWNSDQEVFLWNVETSQTEIVSLSGVDTQYDSLQGIYRIVTGNGVDQALAMTSDGGLYIVAGRGWTRIESSLREVNYSG